MAMKKDHHRDEAYSLSTPAQHRAYYDAWAKTYDDDFVAADGYASPQRCAEIFAAIATTADAPIADLGCGTGLVGQHLRSLRVKGDLHGIDISQGMIDIAKANGGYDDFHLADITTPLTDNLGNYGGIISAGTFTLGHLGPEDLGNALSLARQGGLILVSINAVHFEEKGFGAYFEEWQNTGLITAPIFHEISIYEDPDAVIAGSKMAYVAEFRLK